MPTVLFKVLFVIVVLAHERRRVVHINVTDAPTAQWTAQQLVEAFPGGLPRDTSCAIAMRCTGSRSRGARSPLGSTKSRRRLGRLGRIRTWNVSSAPSAASVSTMWRCRPSPQLRSDEGGSLICYHQAPDPSRCALEPGADSWSASAKAGSSSHPWSASTSSLHRVTRR